MRKITEIPSTQDGCPMELRHLRVAAYCRVSTDLEEQTRLNLKERLEFQKMIRKCRKGEIDLLLTKSISRFRVEVYE